MIKTLFPEAGDHGPESFCQNTPEFRKRAQSLLVVVSSEPERSYEDFTSKVQVYNTKAPFQFPLPAVFENKFIKVFVNNKSPKNIIFVFNFESAASLLIIETFKKIIRPRGSGIVFRRNNCFGIGAKRVSPVCVQRFGIDII